MALSMIPFISGRFKLENFHVGALMYFCSRYHNKQSVLQNKFFEVLLAVLHRNFELLCRIAETSIAISAILNIKLYYTTNWTLSQEYHKFYV